VPGATRTRVEGILCTITDRIDRSLLETYPALRVVSSFGVGLDHIDIPAATARGVIICHTPGVLTEATADLAFGLCLDAARRITEGDRLVRAGRFRGWGPDFMLGREVWGSTLGIVGLGRIGRAVARRARGFGMKVIYASRRRAPRGVERALGAQRVSLSTLLRRADIVSLHVPLGPNTRHLIGTRELARMKPTAILVNTARGPVVDEAALVRALRAGRIAGAGLDVYEREPRLARGLARLANVVLAPHLGSATVSTRAAMGRLAVENLLRALAGRRPIHPANPRVRASRALPGRGKRNLAAG
jgi:glyoxylate reductase